MAPRRISTNQLAKLLRKQKESVVRDTVTDILKLPSFRKKLLSKASAEEISDLALQAYEAIVPLLADSQASRRALRLKKAQKKYLEGLSVFELQRIELVLFEHLETALRKEFSRESAKADRYVAQITRNLHTLLLQSAAAEDRRRRASQRRTDSKYSRLLNMANDAIVLVDFESGLFREANKAACEMTGYSEAELQRTGLNALVSVFDLNHALDKANDAVEQGAVRFDDLSIVTRSGRSVPVDISLSAVMIEGKKHILAILRDIKERKKFEEEIQQKARRLQLLNEVGKAISSADLDIEAVLTSILRSISQVIRVEAGSILKLEEGHLLFLAALGEKAEYVKPFRLKLGQGIAGWAAQHGKGAIVRDVHRDPRYYPEVEQATGFISRSILAVPMKIGEETVGVIELINKMGGPFSKKDLELMEVISSFAAVALGHASLYDECKTARVRLSQMRSPVASSWLAGAVAQEMKDPLGIVKNYIHILGGKLSGAGAQAEELAVISEEVDRLTSITDQLLRFSEAYGEEPKETPLNLLIENTVTSSRERLEAAGIRTELLLEEALPDISVIPNQMNMVFSSLIKLSVAEMPQGGTLTVTTRRRDSSVCVEFSNSGPCHTSAAAEELFLPSGVAKGLVPKGLGLYLVSNIIQSYGGNIKVSTGGGRGNVFSIRLPLQHPGPFVEAVQ